MSIITIFMFCSFMFCSFMFCSFMFCSFMFCSFMFCSFLFCSFMFCSFMFCSLDIFRYVLTYPISCSETISSQYVRIVDICQELGYLVFLVPNVASQCSEFSYSATNKNSTKFLLDLPYTIVYSMRKMRY